MALSGSVFSNTLQEITATKLAGLEEKRLSYQNQRQSLLVGVTKAQTPLHQLIYLVDGLKRIFYVPTDPPDEKYPGRLGRVSPAGTNNHLGIDLQLIDHFIEQASVDPSVSPELIKRGINTLQNHVKVQESKYEYATLFGKLVTEWLPAKTKDHGDAMDISGSFEELPDSKKMESRLEWEETVFETTAIDESALQQFLVSLFQSDPEADDQSLSQALKSLQNDTRDYGDELRTSDPFDRSSLRWAIAGLISSALLSDDQRAALKDFQDNPVILSEIADVLNMRLSNLENWTWGKPVAAIQRKTINGTYEIHLQEDLLQAIFLQLIGVKWSVYMKARLKQFRKTKGVWTSSIKPPTQDDLRRRLYFLRENATNRPSLERKRISLFSNKFFLSHLPSSESQFTDIDEGDEEADVTEMLQQGDVHVRHKRVRTKQTARKSTGGIEPKALRMASVSYLDLECEADRDSRELMDYQFAAPRQYTAPRVEWDAESSDEWDSDEPRRPMALKQDLLHLIAAEAALNKQFHGEFSCLKAAFDRWNTLLPHATVLTILQFFGIPEEWMGFFRKFLETPIAVEGHEDARTRKRGAPAEHALSDVLGESVLFCLDFAVNQDTKGGLLHRLHDEMWYWGHDHTKIVEAWETIQKFTSLTGVVLDDLKSGSIRVGGNGDEKSPLSLAKSLPQNPIRWGFLRLDPISGVFEIDKKLIDHHIISLKKQLQSRSDKLSLFELIHLWNVYAARFMTTNFGTPSNAFGKHHIQSVIETHEQVHRALFSSVGQRSIHQQFKDLISERFGYDNIPDGFLFFPISRGGLAMTNPFVTPIQLSDVIEDSDEIISDFLVDEKQSYLASKKAYESFGYGTNNHVYLQEGPGWTPSKDTAEPFMSFDEYTHYREIISNYSAERMFQRLLATPKEVGIQATSNVLQALTTIKPPESGNIEEIRSDFPNLEPYWKWVVQMYGPEIIERFGGLDIVDSNLLPIGMISILKQARVDWAA